jgi:hypothetical protein
MSAAPDPTPQELPPPTGAPTDPQALASSLAPAIAHACDDRLRDLRWFRADWQRGGAATGRAVYDGDHAAPLNVIIKVPVGHAELHWTRRLQTGAADQVVPRMLAGGDHLGGYDIGWIVIEAIPFGPLGARWVDSSIPRIADAAARFYEAASGFAIDRPPVREDWDRLLHDSRVSVQTNALAERQRWTAALKSMQARLATIEAAWNARACATWLHGDLHPANAMCRSAGDDAPVTLIDLAEVHCGHWVEDAIYLERLHWTRPERIKSHKPVREIASAMRARHLHVGDDYQLLASIRRAFLAATAPRFMKTEGSPAHLHACLERLESSLHAIAEAGL